MDTTPRLGDTDNNLLFKIAESVTNFIPGSGITQAAADVRYVFKAGDTMTGPLVLPSGDVQLKLGGATASFPAIGNSGTTLDVKLANDSNWAPLKAGAITAQTGGMVLNTEDSATVFAYQHLFQKRGTTGNATAAVTDTSELGAVSFRAWNGSAYVTCAQIVARAGQDQSVGNSGGVLNFTTTPVGSASAFVRVIISQPGNLLLSNLLATAPASLVGGLVWKDGTAASADPTTGSALWSVGGALQYRTSGANDGTGRTHHVHNRAAQQAGVGTNYTLTGSTAQVNFGTTNAAVTLPTVGTYLVQANVSIINGATADDIYNAKLRDTTNGADLGVNKKVSGGPASGRVNAILSQIVTTSVANTVVQLFAFNETAARGTVESTTTDMSYVRLS